MVVAVNLTGFSGESNFDGLAFFQQLAEHKPAHKFVFVTDEKPGAQTSLPANVEIVYSRPVARPAIFRKHWYNRTLPTLVKNIGANLLVHASGMSVARCNVRQIVFAHNYYSPEVFPTTNKVLKAYFQKQLATIFDLSSLVIVRSRLEKNFLAERYKSAAEKLRVLPPFVNERYAPSDFFNNEKTKEKYTDGKEYFLYQGAIAGNENALVTLLKAFSFLKKRQKTNMQLLLLAVGEAGVAGFAEKLRSYKYRNDVQLLDELDEKKAANIVAGAYAFVYPLPAIADTTFILRALQSGVPIITTNCPLTKEIAGDAGLYIDPSDFMDIANNLMLIFKDEAARARLEQQALGMLEERKPSSALDAFWRLVEEVG